MDLLHALLDRSAERFPEKAVFVGAAGTTTYRELATRAAALAGALREHGVRRGDRVALLLDGDVDYLVAFYGILAAGAAAVPLCPDTRSDPLLHALQHSEACAAVLDARNLRYLEGRTHEVPQLRALLVRGAPAMQAPGRVRPVPFAEAISAGLAAPDVGLTPEDLAAIVYTSGTTGRPKGAMLAHRNLVANIRSIVEYLELGPEDTAGMVLPFYYVYGNSVLHTHVAAGATIAQLGSMTFVAEVIAGLARHRCTGLSGVPSTFARLCSFEAMSRHDLSALRYVTQAGAAMAPALVQRLRSLLPQARVFVMYGQTEASARLSYVPPERLDEKLGSAGKAIPGVTLKIVDPEGRELPRGEIGEVVAQGENVMLGYFRDPEATARALRPEGLRTGDVGYMDEEGYLFLQGRATELIKSGGHRISPYEVEAPIATVPGVQEVAVCGVPDELLGEAVVAWIVPAEGARPTRAAVLAACHAALPRFKVPARFFLVPSLPRTESGKLRRRALAEGFEQGEGAPLA